MDPAEKIVTALAMAALIGVLVIEHGKTRRRDGFAMRDVDADSIPTARLGASTNPTRRLDCGPAYLVANMPRRRDYDYYAPPVSCGGC